MCYYEIMSELTRLIDNKINDGLNSFLKKYEGMDNYFLVYPLLNIELGAMSEPPESNNNLFNRCIVGFLYKYIVEVQISLKVKTINAKGLLKYQTKVHSELIKLFQDYRLLREVKVGNAISRAKLETKDINKYKLIKSLVYDKYKEENFYFFGFDNIEEAKKEKDLIINGHTKFWDKYVISQYDDFQRDKMEEYIDLELLTYCKSLVRKDLTKWNGNVRSSVFKNIEELCDVIGFLYYLAFLRSMKARIISTCIGFDKSVYDILLMKYDKKWLIAKVSETTGCHINKVTLIINYLINEGGSNVLEFPLFQISNYVITVPSLIMVNDWQFTIINGHYTKKIDIRNRQKTISKITESRIQNLLKNVNNVLLAEEKYYEYTDGTGIKKNSDIDYAIYDLLHNKLLIIEAKWKDNHYYDEIDKSYIKIEDTVNDIFNTQIFNHKKFLCKTGSIEYLFDNNEKLRFNNILPEIFYIAVDKRSQFHKNGNHMLSEFMLLYFLKDCIREGCIDLRKFIDEISTLETKVDYIQYNHSFKELTLIDGCKIEQQDLYLDYKF